MLFSCKGMPSMAARVAAAVIASLMVTTDGKAGKGADVFGQLSNEGADCAAYYTFLKECAPVTASAEELDRVQSWAEQALESQRSLQRE